MFVTKHAAELCALLVNDLYGELPSRILAALFTKGRSTITQLGLYTQLGPRQIRNGLGVLIQQNLLYHHTDADTKRTTYEANPGACYNLVRSGKILEMIESQYGKAERDLVQTLLLLGYARIAELTHAYVSRAPRSNGHANGNGVNGADSGLIESEAELHNVLSHLIRCEIIETVRPQSFRNPSDVYHEIEAEVTKTAPGEKATKTKIDQQRQIMEQYRAFKDQPKALKRQLDQFGGPVTKRRKLGNGLGEEDRAMEDDMPPLNPNVVVRVNYDKCLVELRSHRLASFAKDTLGEVTGEVYRTLLGLLTMDVSRCRADPFLGEDSIAQQATATTMDVYEHLDESVNVTAGIGKAPKDKIDYQSAEKIKTAPAGNDMINDDSDEDPSGPFDSDDSDDMGTKGSFSRRSRSASKTNGARPTKMRAHLLLLAESKHRFVRHCGTQGRGQWTVDFDQVMERLRETELDASIEQSFGRHGLRLTRILREKGKLDEKMLPSAALMKKTDVQAKMLAMQMAGLVDVQEVPKDNTRVANRTLFFWFFDRERSQAQILDDLYKAMVRALQTLQVERHRERNILSFVERKDVMGKEEENKLLGQVMRLDEMVSIFREY
ncbi:RNA polymerase III subunit RPC82 domain-containing protein [Trichoderma breve]|uniref:DNA-directed RNA polymerase III subunit RPC3 n=1 Tax=Trichoderma breve TaxID=2034170 RepID=A0A9W9B6U8_9HYPO|nr:RNA polymerase III subunit RPC82 domain-containing protein [Trichoderma breve]KAJ4857575.1 RNA polymerase III subunit RPC82 domain-containing protein [Trichoderma breve]